MSSLIIPLGHTDAVIYEVCFEIRQPEVVGV